MDGFPHYRRCVDRSTTPTRTALPTYRTVTVSGSECRRADEVEPPRADSADSTAVGLRFLREVVVWRDRVTPAEWAEHGCRAVRAGDRRPPVVLAQPVVMRTTRTEFVDIGA